MPEQLGHEIAVKFANKCFTPLELRRFKQVFRSLADTESDVKYWSESTLCRFLELPDALNAGPILNQICTYLGAFPFPNQAPCILTLDALVKVVTLMTERYKRVLKREARDRVRLLYRSMAVMDRRASQSITTMSPDARDTRRRGKADNEALRKIIGDAEGYNLDEPADKQEQAVDEEDEKEDADEDELALAALESLDAVKVFELSERLDIRRSIVPTDNMQKLLELLLLIAPLDPQESLSNLADRLSEKRIQGLRRTASNILWSFGVEKQPGVTYEAFTSVTESSLPFIFDGLSPLFEHFLFVEDSDLSKRKDRLSFQDNTPEPPHPPPPLEPLLPKEGEVLDLNVLSQLSFFIEPTSLFRRLSPLYSGNDSGFSMGAFEKGVFNWRAPTLLLVSGSRFSSSNMSSRQRAFSDNLPPKRLPDSGKGAHQDSGRVVFGAYINVPWKHTHKECFGDSETLLFQLEPIHDVFRASRATSEYVIFSRQPAFPSGIGFGVPPPSSSAARSSRLNQHIPLGPVSLFLDDSLEFGVFTHHGSAGGGSFHTSSAPSRRNADFQDRFEIESLEVWGCGGDDEAEKQRQRWKWEEREAEARRRINLGTGDIEADREFLRMAGLIGQGQSGGSMT